MKTFTIIFILILGLLNTGQKATDLLPSNIQMIQTGTISNAKMGGAISDFQDRGCHEIVVFEVTEEQSNVACLEIIIAETAIENYE